MPNTIDDDLIFAVKSRDLKGVKQAIENGANPNVVDDNFGGYTPLMHALPRVQPFFIEYNESMSIVRYLVEEVEVDVNAGRNNYPLRIATIFNNEDLINYLTEHGAVHRDPSPTYHFFNNTNNNISISMISHSANVAINEASEKSPLNNSHTISMSLLGEFGVPFTTEPLSSNYKQ